MRQAMVNRYYRKGIFTLFCLCIFLFSQKAKSQSIGDYRTTGTGLWSSSATWQIWTGATWNAAGVVPNSANNVWIQSGHIITAPVSGPYNCKNLVIDAGGKLYTNQMASNVYVGIWGTSVICNGEIGNGASFDGISFNFDAPATTISGSGIITASRFRKNATTNVTTNLIIATNVTLRWDQASNTQIYNNTSTAGVSSRFNVTINAGASLNCVGSATNPGNASVDGVDGTGSFPAGGTYTVNGTFNVAGKIYLRTNNTTAGDSCSWIVNNGGVLKCGSVFVGTSGAAGNLLRIMQGGKLEISGSPGIESSPAFGPGSTLPTANNGYLFYPGSYCEYSAAGAQYVPAIPNTAIGVAGVLPTNNLNYYGYLKVSGSGTKSLIQQTSTVYPFRCYNDFEISNATGSPVFDCNNWTIDVGGNWINYNQSGFTEGSGGRVRFWNPGTSTITCPGGEVFNILTYNKAVAAQVRFNCKVTVDDVLEWAANGAYDLNGNDLVLLNSANTACANSGSALRYIISERTDNSSRVIWKVGTPGVSTTYTIPFGKSASFYVPFSFRVPAGVNADSMKVATYATPATNLPWPTTPDAVTNLNGVFNPVPDNRDAVVDRFWQVNSTAAVKPSLDYTFTYLAAELPVAPYNNASIIGAQNWNTSTSVWRLPVIGTGAAYTVNVTGTNFQGPWTLVGYTSPLPVEWLGFSAHKEGTAVRLNWATASEQNNLRFEIERSADGRNFSQIQSMPGAGTSTVSHEYTALDESPLAGISYYRLAQVDVDGTINHSKIVVINFRKELSGLLYPQPASDLVFWEPEDKSISSELIFSLYTPAGALVQSEKLLPSASGNYPLHLDNLAGGIYFLQIGGEGIYEQVPLLINR